MNEYLNLRREIINSLVIYKKFIVTILFKNQIYRIMIFGWIYESQLKL